MNYETIIGLEVHAQLLTRSKMYCGCSADYASAPPNTHVCPVCLGMPGVLPVINKQAVEYTMMTALALNCPISDYTKFDRKNYPYPDLMKGYQISQYDAPIGQKGWLTIEVDGETKKIGITRVHLEEDVAKLLHRSYPNGEEYSLVDVNRSGVPLMEIVGEPDLRSPEEARQYLIKLRSILQYLGVSTGNMEEGSFRCDANISLRPEGSQEFTAKVEVKNMNSFKAVYLAMEYEAKRQRQAAAEGKRLIQETRGWVEAQGITVSQRSKEYAHDYRYFPEPDLPPLLISREWVEQVRAKLPELPEARRDRFMAEYGLPFDDANELTKVKAMADYFEESTKSDKNVSPKEVSNWLMGEASRIINANNIDIEAFRKKVKPEDLPPLIASSHSTINIGMAKSVLEEMYQTTKTSGEIIVLRGLAQISDTGQLEQTILEVINSNAQPVSDYRAGKEQAFKFLVGQVMKATKGRANPKLVNEVLRQKLAQVLNPAGGE
ncbi:MAG: glutaminyl-tRNA synthase (glutamine-hydrolyzing) subunit B [Chloroflexi bacterium RBG_16_50_9]|nr:MAG: glutaminyl-tRNA synthase (glutamine-hydrolyzing) subunit B [Chloroflexi bacterium RBG_16_50_9]